MNKLIACAACGYRGTDGAWPTTFCPRCSAFNLGLYLRDHADPERAKGMTMAEVRAEYAAAGLVFGPMAGGGSRYQHRWGAK
ncbi:MAG: hypothetical protein M3464_06030 [Chloroflexota bacterium]|nr:hypothetical protein [Chloroflexota bacterium]